MLTVDLLKEKFKVKEDQELAELLGKSPAAISKWRAAGEVPPIAEKQAFSILQKSRFATAINGDGHHIDIHHVAEEPEKYSVALTALKGLAAALPDKYIWKLVSAAIEYKEHLNGNGNGKIPEEG